MTPDTDALDRRTVLRGAAGVLAAGALAGCSGGDSGSNGSDGSGTDSEAATGGDATNETTAADGEATSESTDNGSSGNASSANGTAGANGTGEANGTTGANATTATNGTAGMNDTSATNGTAGTTVGTGAVDEYLAEAKGYDGSIADETGSDAIEIAVGAGENGFAFGPAAVRVSPGTTITWTWTGEGGTHNVVSEDGPLNSGQPEMGEDVTYEETLDSPGVYPYYCNPHRSLGMKGAVVVASE
ncbi:halocyanin domain-containing protein [Halococcus salifodinae]|nr:halocyanin domain-containing protein [Halococcus salifodinae]